MIGGLDFDNSGEISKDELKDALMYVNNSSSGLHGEGAKQVVHDQDALLQFFEV